MMMIYFFVAIYCLYIYNLICEIQNIIFNQKNVAISLLNHVLVCLLESCSVRKKNNYYLNV